MPSVALRPCRIRGCKNVSTNGACPLHPPRTAPSGTHAYMDPLWRRRRARILANSPNCESCGAIATDVDHIIPRSRGGSEDDSNLQALCHACHSKKTTTTDSGGWRAWNAKQVRA